MRGTIAARRDRFSPVFPVEECTPLCYGNFAAILDQPGAALTFDNLPVIYDKVRLITVHD